jgi:anti-sigma B factor antagonist
MNLKVKSRQANDITILDLNGTITLGEGSVTLRDAIREHVRNGQKKLLINLEDVNYMDSSGLGELVSAYASVKNAGGELKLLHLTKKVQDLLQITKLYTVFDVADDETRALGSFHAV